MTDDTPSHPRVLRFAVPVDDAWHAIGSGPVVHVDCRNGEYDVVQVWTLEPSIPATMERYVRVFGTGHHLTPDTGAHLGTALTAGRALVWHVFERVSGDGR